jgi:hypothetical protein
MASVDTSWLIISTCQSTIVADVALDVIGNRVAELFSQTNTSGINPGAFGMGEVRH